VQLVELALTAYEAIRFLRRIGPNLVYLVPLSVVYLSPPTQAAKPLRKDSSQQ